MNITNYSAKIDIYASQITQMESKTRYLKSYSVAAREVRLGFDLATNIIHKLNELETTKDEKNAHEYQNTNI